MTLLTPENARPAPRFRLSFRAAFTALAILFSMAVLAIFAFSLAARHFLLAELISSFRTQLAVLLLVCGCCLLLLRQKLSGWTLTLISLWQLLTLASIFLPTTQPPAGDDQLKIMSMNVLADNREYQQVIDHVAEVSPDVLLIIEYSNQWHQALQALHSAYPYRLLEPRWHGYGIAMFSKRPLENTNTWQLTADLTDVPALTAEVKVGDRIVHLAGLHTMSPTSSLRLNLRNSQMEQIADYFLDSNEPKVLMGDFNCTPWSPFFKDLIERCDLRDSRQGQGYLASWNLETPALFWIPIDHGLVSSEIHVDRRTVGSSCGSDHRPMILEVSVAP